MVGLGKITAQQGVAGEGVDLGDDASSNGGELELSPLWKLCRTSSTSSPAEETRSTVHNDRGLFSMRYLKPSGFGVAGRLLDKKVIARSSKLPGVENRNTSRACLRSLIEQEHSPERNG